MTAHGRALRRWVRAGRCRFVTGCKRTLEGPTCRPSALRLLAFRDQPKHAAGCYYVHAVVRGHMAVVEEPEPP